MTNPRIMPSSSVAARFGGLGPKHLLAQALLHQSFQAGIELAHGVRLVAGALTHRAVHFLLQDDAQELVVTLAVVEEGDERGPQASAEGRVRRAGHRRVQGRQQIGPARLHEAADERVAIGEVIVKRSHGHPSARRDVLHARRVQPRVGKHLLRGQQDGFVGALAGSGREDFCRSVHFLNDDSLFG